MSRICCISSVFASFLLIVMPASAVVAQLGQWRATQPDMREVRGSLDSLEVTTNDFRASLSDKSGEVVLLEHLLPTGYARATGRFTLHLVDGDALRGELIALDDAAITIEMLDFGEVQIPLEAALALVVNDAGADRAWWAERPTGDQLELANGDGVEGFVSGFDAEEGTLSLEPDAGGSLEVPISTLRSLRFADAGAEIEPAEQPIARVALTDGSLVSVTEFSREDNAFTMTYRDQSASVSPEGIHAIEPASPSIVWLADMIPTAIERTPYFTASSTPQLDGGLASVVRARLNENARGRSIHVHSRTSVTFDVPDGEWARLRVTYRIDPAALPAEFADVDVRILFDGKVAHEQTGVTASTPEQVVNVPLEGATSIEFIVDFGKGLDTHDALVWERPALLR